jgi:hypothetical protein
MPLRVADQTPWRHECHRLRWARPPRKGFPRGKDSADLIGNSGRRPSPARDRRGRERTGSMPGPGSFSWPPEGPRHHLGMKSIWSLRPRGTSAKNWSPDVQRWTIRAAVLQLEWIAQGLTALSFWTAPWPREAKPFTRITGLEDRLRRQGHRPNALTGPSESG